MSAVGELKNPGKILTPEFLVLNAVLFKESNMASRRRRCRNAKDERR